MTILSALPEMGEPLTDMLYTFSLCFGSLTAGVFGNLGSNRGVMSGVGPIIEDSSKVLAGVTRGFLVDLRMVLPCLLTERALAFLEVEGAFFGAFF